MRRDGCPMDASCYSAYLRGKRDDGDGDQRIEPGERARRMLQSGYERLLALELAPEQVDGPRLLGAIERIRIQFDPPQGNP